MNALLLGREIANRREYLGITQGWLAKKAGVSVSTIKFIETGRSYPKLNTLEKIAEVLEYDLLDLLCAVEQRERGERIAKVNIHAFRSKTEFLEACRESTGDVCDEIIYDCLHTIYNEYRQGDYIEPETGEVIRQYFSENIEPAYLLAELALKIKESKK